MRKKKNKVDNIPASSNVQYPHPSGLYPPPIDPLYNVFVSEGLVVNNTESSGVLSNFTHTSLPISGVVNNDCFICRSEVKPPPPPKNGEEWLAKVNPKYLVYPNGDITKEPLVKVDGLKELAEMRGFDIKKVKVIPISERLVAVKVKMRFVKTEHYPELWVEAAADATPENIGGDKFGKYLTTMAETRAFGRCIRDALGIRNCTFEEVSRSDINTTENNDNEPVSDALLASIQRQMEIKKVKVDQLAEKIKEANPEATELSQLKTSSALVILRWLNEIKIK